MSYISLMNILLSSVAAEEETQNATQNATQEDIDRMFG